MSILFLLVVACANFTEPSPDSPSAEVIHSCSCSLVYEDDDYYYGPEVYEFDLCGTRSQISEDVEEIEVGCVQEIENQGFYNASCSCACVKTRDFCDPDISDSGM